MQSRFSLFGVISIIVALTYALSSCESDSGYKTNRYQLSLVDSLTMEPLSTVNVNSLCAKYYTVGDKEFLFWGNRPQNSIEVFNLKEGAHFKTIKFPREGPNSISNIDGGFSIINFDSIFVSNLNLGKIYLFDSAGLLDKVFTHSDTSYRSANNLININSNYHSNIYSSNNQIIFPFRTAFFPVQPSDSIVNSLQVIKIFNKAKNRFNNPGLKFDPAIYRTLYLTVEGSNAMIDNRFYYQIATQSAIRYSDDFQNRKLKDVPSRYFNGYSQMSDFPKDIKSFKASEFTYKSLIEDPFRNLLYRVIKLPVSDIQTADLDKEFNDVYEKISIMTLNKDLDILGEHLFDHSNYSWNECFVGKKGLYILRSPYHPNYFEPRITYDIYQITPTDKEDI